MARAAKAGEIQEISFSDAGESDEEFALPEDFEPVEPDPEPNRRSRGSSSVSASKTRVTIAARKAVVKEVGSLAEMLAELWEMRDPYCGGIALDRSAKISEAWADWICEHPAWVAAITDAGQSAKLFRAVYATAPLLAAVYGHHVSHTVQLKDEGGEVDYAQFAPVPDAS